jgi:PPOX class probable F420-dependent enzyme
MIDAGTKAGAHALERLQHERVAWLTTVTPEGQPQTLPIWFIWEDGTILLYSRKVAVRNANLRENPRVAFHLSDDGAGGDIVEIAGVAVLDATAPPSSAHASYQAKYAEMLASYGWTPEYFAEAYPHPYRITPTVARYH